MCCSVYIALQATSLVLDKSNEAAVGRVFKGHNADRQTLTLMTFRQTRAPVFMSMACTAWLKAADPSDAVTCAPKWSMERIEGPIDSNQLHG